MSNVQYVFCIFYLIVSIVLLVLIAIQQGQERNGLSSLSGTMTNDTYFSKNQSMSVEVKLKKWTKIFAFLFFLVNTISLFIL